MSNDFDEYQDATQATAIYPNKPSIRLAHERFEGNVDTEHPLYPFFGLAEEAGEVLGKIKKAIRDGHMYEQTRDNVRAELGDVLWYVARCANHFNIPLSDVAHANITKLDSRLERGAIHGSGDNR